MGALEPSRTPRHPEEFARQVLGIVTTLAANGYPSIRVVAANLGMSTRTMQRRLGDGGVTYARMVAQARAALARHMLEGTTAKVADVAQTLGYSDAGHFSRAFLRWTGVTPRAFRQRAFKTA
jgi:AraC-like DNA-binding protein